MHGQLRRQLPACAALYHLQYQLVRAKASKRTRRLLLSRLRRCAEPLVSFLHLSAFPPLSLRTASASKRAPRVSNQVLSTLCFCVGRRWQLDRAHFGEQHQQRSGKLALLQTTLAAGCVPRRGGDIASWLFSQGQLAT